jgi:hypothetical protein
MGVEFQQLAVGSYAGVEGFDPPPTGLAGRFKATLRMVTFRRIRVWHVERRNRILGVRLEARQPIGAGEWREACDGYGMDDEVENKAACDPA